MNLQTVKNIKRSLKIEQYGTLDQQKDNLIADILKIRKMEKL